MHTHLTHSVTNTHKPLKYFILVSDGEEEVEDGEGNIVYLNCIKTSVGAPYTHLFFLDVLDLNLNHIRISLR